MLSRYLSNDPDTRPSGPLREAYVPGGRTPHGDHSLSEKSKIILLKTNRIEALSDGVFAIAMTIVVLSFDILLEPSTSYTDGSLYAKLISLWPDFLHYVESFIILGCLWIQHHNQLHFIKVADTKMLFINILILMFVAIIPFTTALVGDYGHMRVAAWLFELNLLGAGLMLFANWVYATNVKRFVDPEMDQYTIDYYKRRILITPVVSVFAIAVTFLNPRWGAILFFAIPALLIFYKPKVAIRQVSGHSISV